MSERPNASISQGGWNPDQYGRFQAERDRPFFDLAAMVERDEGMRVLDLGCGDGRLTQWLHVELGASGTLGLDSSPEMLARSAAYAGDGLRFERGDIDELPGEHEGEFDLLFSNAALQWVLDHDTLLPRIARVLKPGGQLAVQMPSNEEHLSHRTAAAVALEEPFVGPLGGWTRPKPVRDPAWYAELLRHELGCVEQQVVLRIYPQELADSRAVIEWVKGTLLTAYMSRLPEELRAPFLERYTERFVTAADERRPYFYPYPRILLWARLPG